MTPLADGNADVAYREIALSVRGVSYAYGDQLILNDINLDVFKNSPVAITGSSGSGKSTLLQILSGTRQPTTGTVLVNPAHPPTNKAGRNTLRDFGFVFQFGELLPELTLLENVELPLLFLGERRATARKRAAMLLSEVGLEKESQRFTHAVSGGQQQRAAIARALIHQPSIVLADEPTGALDDNTANNVLDLMFAASAAQNAALVVVTHSQDVAARCHSVYDLRNNTLVEAVTR